MAGLIEGRRGQVELPPGLGAEHDKPWSEALARQQPPWESQLDLLADGAMHGDICLDEGSNEPPACFADRTGALGMVLGADDPSMNARLDLIGCQSDVGTARACVYLEPLLVHFDVASR